MDSIIDNKKLKVWDVLSENIKKDSKISIISSYFTIFAFDKLKEQLKDIESFRFLFLEPTFTKQKEESREFIIEKLSREKQLSWNEFEIKLRNELNQNAIAKECSDWIKNKAQFKSIKKSWYSNNWKAIHIENHNDSCMIQWTLDFTSSGLWYSNSNRLELNMFSDTTSATKELLSWFDEIWNNSEITESVKDEVLKNIQYIYKENSPEFLYYLTLYNLFKEYLDDISEENIIKTRTNFKETLVWNKLYKFQKDWVMWCIDKLEKHNWCILADSVWLWKTFEALAVIKYYELRNDRVLVLAPKKLRDNWNIYRINDKRNILSWDRFWYDILNHTDLWREKWYSWDINLETINWWNYDLIVIDESHNFRNNDPRKDRVTRYQKLMNDIIKSWVKTKVLMLSATPINNRMNDLKNQIWFITEWNDSALLNVWIDNISITLKKAQTIFNKWMDLSDDERTLENLLSSFNIDYFKLLDTLTIARSRKHIEKYYNVSDIWKFPTRLKPRNIKSDIDIQDEFPSLSDINRKIKRLNLSVYSLLEYVRFDKKREYEEIYNISVKWWQSVFKQSDREKSLINLMRVNILKRLESSVYSFDITLSNILKQIDNTLERIYQFETTHSNNNFDLDLTENELLEENDDTIWDKVQVKLEDMDLLRWKQDLEDDKDLLNDMIKEARKITVNRDAKLQDLKKLIKEKIANPINKNNNKFIIFSSFADTAKYLYENISVYVKKEFSLESALVTWSWNNKVTTKNISTDLSSVLINFSPISKEKEKIYPNIKEDIDILIATDCISEWQNLQDCDFLVNYDIHWNPVRIIQRFWRIDRIWSKNDVIQLVNFWPNVELDEYINLEARVRWRMVLLDSSATWEDNVIEINSSKEMNDLQYRKKQLEQIQNEVVDIEDLSNWVTITDLTMNDFKMDLSEYLKENKEILEKSSTWVYALTKAIEGIEWAEPGVIFTLKQIKASEVKSTEQNALHPYYIVYIKDNWEIQYSYLQAKKTLDIFKKLCTWNKEIFYDLIDLFDKQTQDWKNMKDYSSKLEEVISNIVWNKKEKEIESIFTLWESSLATNKIVGLDDFELISFLIIK